MMFATMATRNDLENMTATQAREKRVHERRERDESKPRFEAKRERASVRSLRGHYGAAPSIPASNAAASSAGVVSG